MRIEKRFQDDIDALKAAVAAGVPAGAAQARAPSVELLKELDSFRAATAKAAAMASDAAAAVLELKQTIAQLAAKHDDDVARLSAEMSVLACKCSAPAPAPAPAPAVEDVEDVEDDE
jgi:glutamate-1-semialdehyde aminotransferase